MKYVNVIVSSHYSKRQSKIRASVRKTVNGRDYLEVSKSQIDRATEKCCYPGDDAVVLSLVDGFGAWVPFSDGSMTAYSIKEAS